MTRGARIGKDLVVIPPLEGLVAEEMDRVELNRMLGVLGFRLQVL